MNVYQMVTDRIIAELEQGTIPWRKPWSGVANGAYNRISHKPYSLLNQMILQHSGEYATYKQWKQLGGQVRKGEKSEFVVFWKILKKVEQDDDGEDKVTTIPMLRYYDVFHISQVDGVKPEVRESFEVEPIEAGDKVIADYISRENISFLETESNDAYYAPALDKIVVPQKNQYQNINEYYSTVFHEMIHSTGHESRLNRITKTAAFGNQDYSKEELVAEVGAASMLNQLGIESPESFKNSAAYIQSWIKALKNDTRFIVSAASKAEKAVKFINGEQEQ